MYLYTAIALIFCLVYLDIPAYIFVLNSAILPKYFYYTLFAFTSPFLVLKFKEFILYMASPFALWMYAEIIVNSWYLIQGNEIVNEVIKDIDLNLIMCFVFAFIAKIAPAESYQKLFPVLATIIPMCVIFDFVSPGFFYPIGTELTVIGRASAMYIVATRTAEVTLITCLLALLVINIQYRLPLVLLSGIAVLVTFSRGSIAIWIILVGWLIATRKISKYSLPFLLGIITILPMLLVGFKSYIQSRQDLDFGLDNILDRLNFFQTRSLEDASAQERLEVLKAGWQLFIDNPIFGAGSGATTIWSHRSGPHNQFITAGAEHGLLGIALWLWLLIVIWQGNYFKDKRFQLAFAIGTFFFSFFTHNLMTTPFWLITFALLSGDRQIGAYLQRQTIHRT